MDFCNLSSVVNPVLPAAPQIPLCRRMLGSNLDSDSIVLREFAKRAQITFGAVTVGNQLPVRMNRQNEIDYPF